MPDNEPEQKPSAEGGSRLLDGLKSAWHVPKNAALGFIDDSCFRSSAALAFYSLISIAPLVLITIAVGGLFVDNAVVRDEITAVFRSLIGEEGARGVFVLLDTLRTEDSGVLSISFGVLLLIFSSTTILVQVKNGFNDVFKVKPVEGRKGFLKQLLDRLVSMGLILSLGFAMIISLTLDTIIIAVVDVISQQFETVSLVLLQVLQNLITLALVFIVIFAMFRFLADVEVQRKFLIRGAAITTVVLLIGKFVIGWYIGQSNLTALGGAASSIVVLMLWVYYSALILFFGAELVRAQAELADSDYRPGKYAKKVKVVEIEEVN